MGKRRPKFTDLSDAIPAPHAGGRGPETTAPPGATPATSSVERELRADHEGGSGPGRMVVKEAGKW